MVRRGHGINRLLRYACSGENRQDWQDKAYDPK